MRYSSKVLKEPTIRSALVKNGRNFAVDSPFRDRSSSSRISCGLGASLGESAPFGHGSVRGREQGAPIPSRDQRKR
jgi:hypothetical protein